MVMTQLTQNEFTLMNLLIKYSEGKVSQRAIAECTGLSLGTVNKTLKDLTDKRYIVHPFGKGGHITDNGMLAMEPYRVKRAVFLAAGFGSRLVPITFNTPKPLVRVHGVRIIDTLLDAVTAAGINDITIVRGYLGEQFDQLLYKYPNIKFVENPVYLEANNISSALCVRYMMQNAYVLESDLLLKNKDLITPYQYTTNYLGVPVAKTDDWCFYTNSKRIIKKMAVGGTDCYHMFGISYWNQTDGAKMAEHIKLTYEMPGGKERYWDQVALQYFISEYEIEARPCTFDDIAEIDTFKELKEIDKTYETNMGI